MCQQEEFLFSSAAINRKLRCVSRKQSSREWWWQWTSPLTWWSCQCRTWWWAAPPAARRPTSARAPATSPATSLRPSQSLSSGVCGTASPGVAHRALRKRHSCANYVPRVPIKGLSATRTHYSTALHIREHRKHSQLFANVCMTNLCYQPFICVKSLV